MFEKVRMCAEQLGIEARSEITLNQRLLMIWVLTHWILLNL